MTNNLVSDLHASKRHLKALQAKHSKLTKQLVVNETANQVDLFGNIVNPTITQFDDISSQRKVIKDLSISIGRLTENINNLSASIERQKESINQFQFEFSC